MREESISLLTIPSIENTSHPTRGSSRIPGQYPSSTVLFLEFQEKRLTLTWGVLWVERYISP